MNDEAAVAHGRGLPLLLAWVRLLVMAVLGTAPSPDASAAAVLPVIARACLGGGIRDQGCYRADVTRVAYRCEQCEPTGAACDACIERWLASHGPDVLADGRAWAERVASRMPEDPSQWPAWPGFDDSDKVQDIAARLSADSAGLDPRMRDVFARVCHAAAARHYEAERARRGGTG